MQYWKLIMLLGFLNLSGLVNAQNIVISPSYESKATSEVEISSIELNRSNTIVNFTYTTSLKTITDGGFCLSKNMVIRNSLTYKQYGFFLSSKITECPTQMDVDRTGQVFKFQVRFEALPKTIALIDIVELGKGNGLNFYKINLKKEDAGSDLFRDLRSDAKLYAFPSHDSKVLADIYAGSKVKILGEKLAYYHVEYNQKRGYVQKVYFEVDGVGESESFINQSTNYGQGDIRNLTDWQRKDFVKYLIDNDSKDPIVGIYTWSEILKTSQNGIEVERKTIKQGSSEVAIIEVNNELIMYRVKSPVKLIAKVEATHLKENYIIEGKSVSLGSPRLASRCKKLSNFEVARKLSKTEPEIKRLSISMYSCVEYSKVYSPSLDNEMLAFENVKSTGTGFALTSDGYIVTNYHVIDNATSILVEGVKGFDKTLSAQVIVVDRVNDLAVLKITDRSFSSLGQIPYSFSYKPKAKGSTVFSLGYPQASILGTDAKLTSGRISALTGPQTDTKYYQTTVPIQPGSSGGPLFTNEGELVGVFNSAHPSMENVSYAIKSMYLQNLIYNIPGLVQVPNHTTNWQSFTEHIDDIQDYIYYIQVK